MNNNFLRGIGDHPISNETKMKRQKIGDEKEVSTRTLDSFTSELIEEATLQQEIEKASEAFVQENICNSISFLDSIIFSENIQKHMLNSPDKNEESTISNTNQNKYQLAPKCSKESGVEVLNEKERNIEDNEYFTKGNMWKYIRVSIPQAEALPYFCSHDQQLDLSQRQMIGSIPEETNFQLWRTKYGHFVLTFVERYGKMLPEIVYLDIIIKIAPLTESLLFPDAPLGLQACASATILIGAFQEGCLDKKIWIPWGKMMEACANSFGAMQTIEILYAHILMVMLYFLTHNWDGFLRHVDLVACLFPEVPDVPASFFTCISFFALLKISKYDVTEMGPYRWNLVLEDLQSFPESNLRYPNLVSHAMLNKMNNFSLEGQHKKDVLDSYAKVHSIFIHVSTFELLFDWVLSVAINPSMGGSYKSNVIREMICYFEEWAARWNCPFSKLQPMFQFLVNEAQLIFMLATARMEEAKALIRMEIGKIQKDPTVVSSLLAFTTVHRFHFFCMALSVMQMYEEYREFEAVINKQLEHLELPFLPFDPPASIADLCQESRCYQIWNLVACPHIMDFIHDTIDFTPCEMILRKGGKIST